MRKYCDAEKNRSIFFSQIYLFSAFWIRDIDFWYIVCVYVGMYVLMDGWMCASVAPERLGGFCSCSAFKNLSVIGRFLVSMDIPAPKLKALQISPQTKKWLFSRKRLKRFCLNFSNLSKPSPILKLPWVVSSGRSGARTNGPKHEMYSFLKSALSVVRISFLFGIQ
jgi:hypothetical protein